MGRQFAVYQAKRLTTEAELELETAMVDLQQRLHTEEEMLQKQLGAASQVLSGIAEPVASRFQPIGDLLRRF